MLKFTAENILSEKMYEMRTKFIPIVKKLNEDFLIAIVADYAYLSALNEQAMNYKDNLIDACNEIMALEIYSQTQNWNYAKYYTIGYILYKMAEKGFSDPRTNALLAKEYFYKSLNEITFGAVYLRKILLDHIDFCDEIIKRAV